MVVEALNAPAFVSDVPAIHLGDMDVVGFPPAKLIKALAVIADTLHPSFARNPRLIPGISKESCVLCSLTVREFLVRIGFATATARPVCAVLWATERGKTLHSAGIGHPDNTLHPSRWNGHMVVTVGDFLIDTTLYQVKRPAWPQLPAMLTVPFFSHPAGELYGMPMIAGLALDEPERGYQFSIAWLDNPDNRNWRQGGDGRDRSRRQATVRELVARFGTWRD